MKRRAFRLGPQEASGLASAVSRELGIADEDARKLVERGAVYVRGRRCRTPDSKLRGGDPVSVVLEEGGRSALEPAASLKLRVLFEDEERLAVDKPAGVPTQPTPGRVGDSLADAVHAYLGRPGGLVHRLDRETSGVVLFGKTKAATSRLAAAFRQGEVEKLYAAVTGPGLARDGRVDLPLSRDPSRPGRFRATRAAHGVPALTEWSLLASGDFCLVALRPRTGRTHQLRAHLAALGAPIAGDVRYGGVRALAGLPAGRCLLHAWTLRIAEFQVEAPVPPDMGVFFDRARLPPLPLGGRGPG
jgi:23S rRNA pseudouridine1911/1915/1917 synthase